MGFVFRRRVRLGKSSWLNLRRSGVSASRRSGPLTVNSRGGFSWRFGKGLSYRKSGRR
jgi:hypothetical protein